MIRGNVLMNMVAKLNTFVTTMQAQNQLTIYIEKIMNKKCKSIKYITEFDYVSVLLLYISMESSLVHDAFVYRHIDKKELKFYMHQIKGMDYVTRQVPSIKTEEKFISYLFEQMAEADYIYQANCTVKFSNDLVVPAKWLLDLFSFLIPSLGHPAKEQRTFTYKILDKVDGEASNYNELLHQTILYEYKVTRKDGGVLTYQDNQFITNLLSTVFFYDFNQLKQMNSKFSKYGFLLTITKKSLHLSQLHKERIAMLLNENEDNRIAIEYIKQVVEASNSLYYRNRRKMLQLLEIFRSCAIGYHSFYSLEKMRSLFEDFTQEEVSLCLFFVQFYLTYIYDVSYLSTYFNYEVFDLEGIKPSIIDYETREYKTIIKDLSRLNKKIVLENRKINRYLANASFLKEDKKLKKENEQALTESSLLLESYVRNMNELRHELQTVKKGNHSLSNRNEMKIRYIKEVLLKGTYQLKDGFLVMNAYDARDAHRSFHLEIALEDLVTLLYSEENINSRINFYQL